MRKALASMNRNDTVVIHQGTLQEQGGGGGRMGTPQGRPLQRSGLGKGYLTHFATKGPDLASEDRDSLLFRIEDTKPRLWHSLAAQLRDLITPSPSSFKSVENYKHNLTGFL